jgi:hypothetical protein
MVFRGHVSGGMIVLDEPAPVPDGTPVEVTVLANEGSIASTTEAPSLYERMKGFVGKAETLPEDAALQIDHYLYGLPKR